MCPVPRGPCPQVQIPAEDELLYDSARKNKLEEVELTHILNNTPLLICPARVTWGISVTGNEQFPYFIPEVAKNTSTWGAGSDPIPFFK